MRKIGRKNIFRIYTVAFVLSITFAGCSFEKRSDDNLSAEAEENIVADVVIKEDALLVDENISKEPASVATEEPALTEESTPAPTQEPTPEPTSESTPAPTQEPTPEPTEEPTLAPTPEPTPELTEEPTPAPTEEPQHVHSWSSATCTSPETCNCGETSGSKLGHDFGNNKECSRCGIPNPDYVEQHSHSYYSEVTYASCGNDGQIIYICSCGDTYTELLPANGNHSYGYGETNCTFCGAPHTHDWNLVVQTNQGVEIIPDEDFVCHSGWYFDSFAELKEHMEIPNVHGMVYLNDGSNGVTSVPRDYTGPVDFYACCHGWANCSGDGEGERIEYEITQEVQFCKLCGVRGEAFDLGPRVIISHTIDD